MDQPKIAIFGSAVKENHAVTKISQALGVELAKNKVILITGACSGIPYIVAHEAAQKGAPFWGFSPAINYHQQKQFTPHDDLSIYQRLIYTPRNFPFNKNPQVCRKYRNVISSATCDAGIIIAGRWGTMNEFTNLFDLGKVIGVLKGTGGIADELPNLLLKIKKKSQAKVFVSSSTRILVGKIIKELTT